MRTGHKHTAETRRRMSEAHTKASLEDRFWAKVDKRGSDECWLWTGSLTRSGGYGQIARTRKEGPVRANRVSYELANGQILEGMCVLHECDIPACVNPAHLFLGTRGDNCQDMGRKKRWKNHCASGDNHVPYNSHLQVAQ